MKAVPIFLIFSICAQVATAADPIQFNSDLQKFNSEGMVYQRLVFKDDKRTVYYQPPPGWRCRTEGNRLQLVPADKTFAEAEIASVPLDKPVNLDDSAAAALTQQLMAALPPGSQQATVLKQEQNGVLLNNHPVFELQVSYKVLGETFQRTVFVVYTPAMQITFKLSARKSDFESLYRSFRASIFTWEWQPEKNEPATANQPQA